MKLEKWALVAEIVSGAAIVATLVILVVEVRESSRQTALNTQSLQVGAYQELMGHIVDMNALFIGDPEANDIWIDNVGSPISALSARDRDAARAYALLRLRLGDLAYYQYEVGMVTEERLQSAMRPLTDLSCARLFRSIWSEMKQNFVTGYRDYLDSVISAC